MENILKAENLSALPEPYFNDSVRLVLLIFISISIYSYYYAIFFIVVPQLEYIGKTNNDSFILPYFMPLHKNFPLL